MPHYTLLRRWNLHVNENNNCCSGIWSDEQWARSSEKNYIFERVLTYKEYDAGLEASGNINTCRWCDTFCTSSDVGLFEFEMQNETILTSTVD